MRAAAPYRPGSAVNDAPELRLLLVAEDGFLGEALSNILEADEAVAHFKSACVADAISMGLTAQVDAILICVPMIDDLAAARRLRRSNPGVPVIACGLKETDDNVVAWAEAGVTGYIARRTKLSQFMPTLRQILTGEQPCLPRVMASLLSRYAAIGPVRVPLSAPLHKLTRRERQVAELIAADRSDKEIARTLKGQRGDGQIPRPQPPAQTRRSAPRPGGRHDAVVQPAGGSAGSPDGRKIVGRPPAMWRFRHSRPR